MNYQNINTEYTKKNVNVNVIYVEFFTKKNLEIIWYDKKNPTKIILKNANDTKIVSLVNINWKIFRWIFITLIEEKFIQNWEKCKFFKRKELKKDI